MYAAVRNYAGSADLVDVLVENESEVKRLISEIDGFHAYYLIRTGEGNAVSVSVFEDQDGAEESNRRAADWIRENAADVTPSPPEISAGEVVISF
jgi:heme-degrading monooxygenase HmoA